MPKGTVFRKVSLDHDKAGVLYMLDAEDNPLKILDDKPWVVNEDDGTIDYFYITLGCTMLPKDEQIVEKKSHSPQIPTKWSVRKPTHSLSRAARVTAPCFTTSLQRSETLQDRDLRQATENIVRPPSNFILSLIPKKNNSKGISFKDRFRQMRKQEMRWQQQNLGSWKAEG